VLQEQLRQVGLAVDVVTLDPNALGQRWLQGDYDGIYYGVQASATDPALNPHFWLSSGNFHFWNPHQPSPSTEWERRIDELMQRLATAPQISERQQLFSEVQRIFADEQPAIYFAAPNVTLAVSSRLINPQPVPQIPQLLWSAGTLAAASPAR
jgi:peptide/nickel transport system substrate-binding protein